MSDLSLPQASAGPLERNSNTPGRVRSAKRRPLGVTILAVLYFIASAWLLGTLWYTLTLPPQPLPANQYQASARDLLNWIEWSSIALGLVVTLAGGLGLWWLKGWGRVVSLVVYGTIITVTVVGTVNVLSTAQYLSGSGITIILIAGAVFYYLCRPEVRRAFADEPKA